MSISPELALKVFLSATMTASIGDMFVLQVLKRYSLEYRSGSFFRQNLEWVNRAPFLQQLLGAETLDFMKSRTLWFPFQELLFGSLAVLCLLTYDLSFALLRALVFIYLALLMGVINLRTPSASYAVPALIVLRGIVLGLLTSLLPGTGGLLEAALGAGLGFGIFFLMYAGGLLFAAVANQRAGDAFGWGNITAATMVGAFCGWRLTIFATIIAIELGALGAIAFLIYQRLRRQSSQQFAALPYAHYISIGGVIAITLGLETLQKLLGE
ncbi:MAG: A24 family peptidase [Anaerolineae bacterium]|nr:A24 family peptidase [Anaerolineae bacterium]